MLGRVVSVTPRCPTEILTSQEIDALLRGEAVVRNGSSYEPPPPRPKEPPARRSSVPSSGGAIAPDPEPQPGS